MDNTIKENSALGKIIGVSGGLYKIKTDDGETVFSRAKGAFRHSGLTPLVGDNVRLRFDGVTVKGDESGGGVVIEEVLERKNALIRPPMANLDCMFVSMASASPAPILPTVDGIYYRFRRRKRGFIGIKLYVLFILRLFARNICIKRCVFFTKKSAHR